MGYSIAVPVRSDKLLKKMLGFMDANYRPIPELTKDVAYSCASPPTCNLAYDDGKRRIGFNYGPVAIERGYIYCLVRWMALRVGTRRTLEVFRGSGIRAKMYYVVYDGSDVLPVRLASEWESKKPGEGGWEFCDEHGVPVVRYDIFKPMEALSTFCLDRVPKYVEVEMRRLSELWKNETT